MKKTYAESWFVNCQPGSQIMNDLTRPTAHLSGTAVKILQTEVITKDYVLFEVINENYYNQYNSGLAEVSELKSEIEILENKVEDLEIELDSCKDDLAHQMRLVQELENFNANLSTRNSNLEKRIAHIGEITKCVDETGNDVMFLREFEIDSSLYAELKGLYLDTGNKFLIDEGDDE